MMIMKKVIYMLTVTLSGILLSCTQFSDAIDTEVVGNISSKITINAIMPEGVPAPETYQVKFNNYSEGYELVATADASGVVNVEDIIPGIYTITVSGEVSYDGFTYNCNGSLTNEQILRDNLSYTIDVQASKSGNIIFKELYYCGSKTPSGGSYFRDQYYELYNNSNEVQYLDGLCIGNLNPLTATANLPVWPDEYKDDHVFFITIWQIPGTPGVDMNYPLQPGESVLIAQMADNHQREDLNPACPVNLLSAEFETYVNSTAIIKDNPAINMYCAFWPSMTPQWLVTVFGGAYAIFFPEGEINPNTYVSPVGATSKNKEVKIDRIIDAVELVNDESKMKLKRVPAVLDAGASTVGATYCGKSVSRKIKETLPDGRIIYMDTNNSSEDFQVNDTPVPRRDGAKIPSWNTWAN